MGKRRREERRREGKRRKEKGEKKCYLPVDVWERERASDSRPSMSRIKPLQRERERERGEI